MTGKELEELNVWISEHVMGWKPEQDLVQTGENGVIFTYRGPGPMHLFWPTTNPGDAMEVLKKCAERGSVSIEHSKTYGWTVTTNEPGAYGYAATLESAISLFAKDLFTGEREKP